MLNMSIVLEVGQYLTSDMLPVLRVKVGVFPLQIYAKLWRYFINVDLKKYCEMTLMAFPLTDVM